MRHWAGAVAAGLAVLALQACDGEPPRTTVHPPVGSLPDDAVLRPQAMPAPRARGASVPATASAAVATPVPPAAAQATPRPVIAGARAAGPLPRVPNAGDAQGAEWLARRPLLVPVVGVDPGALSDQYELRRGKRVHEAIDIMAPTGTPVVAVDDGRIAKLFTSRAGGFTVYHFDPAQRIAYYYAHLDRYAAGLREGMEVRRGDLVGYVGSSGNADAKAPHLHFGVFRLGSPPKWWEGEPVNPYPALSRAAPAEVVAAR